MSRKIISFDVDGVLAEGGFTPPEDRNNKVYCKKPVADPEVIPSLQWLSILYDIYCVSTRSHPDANLGLRAWLHFILGLEMDTIAGCITGPSGGAKDNTLMDKADVVRVLGAKIHIDDHPEHVTSMPGVGVLMPSDMPSSQAAAGKLPTVYDWAQLREFLTTPGYTLHGSDGDTVISPCEAEPNIPKIDPVLVKAIAETIN